MRDIRPIKGKYELILLKLWQARQMQREENKLLSEAVLMNGKIGILEKKRGNHPIFLREICLISHENN